MTRHPIAFSPERGAEVWANLPDAPPDLRPLIEGAAGCSPYLARLMLHQPGWLSQSLWATPEDSMATIMAGVAGPHTDDLASILRRQKHRAALIVALADLGGIWDLHTTMCHWTAFADACVSAALTAHVAIEAKRGKIPNMTEDDARQDGAGMVALAMGKMGAGELNYSSDIDLICLFDDDRFDRADEMAARTGFIRATRAMAKTLADVTAAGYVFRTDLRLRPDPSVTPVCISMTAAERYYEAEGRSWERSAYIKARPVAGDITAGQRFLQHLIPFVWRRHMDFTMIEDTMDMRRRVRDYNRLNRVAGAKIILEGHDVKLGSGGIRDIEFFAQTQQLIAGGRDRGLRSRRTVEALSALGRAGWITDDMARTLGTLYDHHREIEHRLQMIEDAQTHTLPKSPHDFDRLARFCGAGDTDSFRANLKARFTQVDALIGGLLAPIPQGVPMVNLTPDQAATVARWFGYPALRSDRARVIFERLKADLFQRLQTARNPKEALANFDTFLRGLPAGVQLFALFQANPPLIDLIVDICGTAPGLSRYLSRHTAVFDAVLDGRFFAPWPGAVALAKDVAASLEDLDYERQLDAARRWQKEWHFRIGVHHLRGLIKADEAAAQYTDLAVAILRALWPCVCAQIARRHGPAPGRGGAIVAMGSLGAGRMTAQSDMDLIVIYDEQDAVMTDGPRPLDPRQWFAKATKVLITALSAPTATGRLYEVDLRLRPSGRQGPVATALDAFRQYQMTDAWTWEHMALTRACVVAGAESLQADIEAIRTDVIRAKADAPHIQAEVRAMRQRIIAAGGADHADSTWAVKDGAGGLQDIDLIAQAAALMAGVPDRGPKAQLTAGAQIGWLSQTDLETLLQIHQSFSQFQQTAALLTDGPLTPQALGAGGQAALARQIGVEHAAALTSHLNQTRRAANAIITTLLTPSYFKDIPHA